MFETMAKSPATITSISLSISNISASLSPIMQCKAKDALMADLGEHLAGLIPQLMALNYEEVDGYEEFLRTKTLEAAKIRSCHEKCGQTHCPGCPFTD